MLRLFALNLFLFYLIMFIEYLFTTSMGLK